jgi:hypothetical protein
MKNIFLVLLLAAACQPKSAGADLPKDTKKWVQFYVGAKPMVQRCEVAWGSYCGLYIYSCEDIPEDVVYGCVTNAIVSTSNPLE